MNTEDIKKEVLNRIKGIKEYKKIPEKKIIQWNDEVPQNEFESHTITEDTEEATENFLYDRKVSEIIDYLSKYKDCILEERHFGYEFCIYRPETSDEIIEIICSEVESNCWAFLEKDTQIAKIDEEIRRLQNKKSELVK